MVKSNFLVKVALFFLAVQISSAYEDDLDPVESSIYEKVSSSHSDRYQFHNSDRDRNVDSEEPSSIHSNSRPKHKQSQSQSYYSSSSPSGNVNSNSKIRSRNGESLSAEYSGQLKERVEVGRGDISRGESLSRIDERVTDNQGRGEISRGESRGRVSESRLDGHIRIGELPRAELHGRVDSRVDNQPRLDSRGEGQLRLEPRSESQLRLEPRSEGQLRLEPRSEGQTRVEGRIEPREDVDQMKPSASSPVLSVAESQQQEQTVQLLPRVSLKHDAAQRECKKCGGFSLGALGGCCKSCAKLGYNKGCWCRACDCLCYDS